MRTESSLKIGLDFHGVINTNPSYFKDFTEYVMAQGHQIYIITGGPASTISSFLKAWGIKYTDMYTIVNHYAALGMVTYFPDGHFEMDEKLWNTAKAKFCQSHHISIMIDDSVVYGRSFTTPYCLYDEVTRTCSLKKGLTISLALKPEACLRQIEKALSAVAA